MILKKAWLRHCLLMPVIIAVSLFWASLLSTQKVLSQTTTEEERGWINPGQTEEPRATGRKVALVIGNADYTVGVPLRNPVNDANDMAEALEDLGFEVFKGTNLNLQEMDELVAEFYQELKNGSVGVFYYAGHGVQSKGENYFMPVDAQVDIEKNLKYAALPMGEVLNYMQEADNDVNIVIIDACRDNPYARGWRSNTRGLASVEDVKGMLISYATSPNDIALDGDGRNGVFTGVLLKYIRQPGVDVDSLMTMVREEVYYSTNEIQWPWSATSLIGDFYFVDQPIIASNPTTPSVEANTIQTEASRNEENSPLPVAMETSLQTELPEIQPETNTTDDVKRDDLIAALDTENIDSSFIRDVSKCLIKKTKKVKHPLTVKEQNPFEINEPRTRSFLKNDIQIFNHEIPYIPVIDTTIPSYIELPTYIEVPTDYHAVSITDERCDFIVKSQEEANNSGLISRISYVEDEIFVVVCASSSPQGSCELPLFATIKSQANQEIINSYIEGEPPSQVGEIPSQTTLVSPYNFGVAD